MAVDRHLLGARLASLDEYLRCLPEMARLEFSVFAGDPRNYASAERFLHLAIEAVLDIGAHLIAALGLPRPERYSDVLPALAEAGVIRPQTAAELSNIAGFRNILVHDYAKIDHQRVYEFLKSKLDGLRRFAADISEYLENREAP